MNIHEYIEKRASLKRPSIGQQYRNLVRGVSTAIGGDNLGSLRTIPAQAVEAAFTPVRAAKELKTTFKDLRDFKQTIDDDISRNNILNTSGV